MDTSRKKSAGILIAASGNRLIALPSEAVRAVATYECSPAQPFAQPWVGGLTCDDAGRVLTVVAPFGVAGALPPRRVCTLVMMVERCGPWALVVDAVTTGTGWSALPEQVRLSSACPAAWLKPVQLADGRAAAWLEVDAVAAACAVGAAA